MSASSIGTWLSRSTPSNLANLAVLRLRVTPPRIGSPTTHLSVRRRPAFVESPNVAPTTNTKATAVSSHHFERTKSLIGAT